jgi:predicted nucleic acid-binding protein
VIVDTSGLLALFNADEPDHHAVAAAVTAEQQEPLVVSPFVLAEVDYLVATRLGVKAELAVLRELAAGAWELPEFGRDDLAVAAGVVQKYADQAIGLADASLVVLATRYGTKRILTLDTRHFHVLRPFGGGRFVILP